MPTKRPAKPAAKKKSAPAKLVTPKVSPNRGVPVPAWVKANTKGWQTQVVNQLLGIAQQALPHATHAIKWSQPVVEAGGPIAYIKVAKAHVTLGFWRGAELSDPDGKLEGGDRMKHIKLASPAEIDRTRFAAWLEEAGRLNAEKGDPSRRG